MKTWESHWFFLSLCFILFWHFISQSCSPEFNYAESWVYHFRWFWLRYQWMFLFNFKWGDETCVSLYKVSYFVNVNQIVPEIVVSQVIARRLLESKQNSPHLYLSSGLDVSETTGLLRFHGFKNSISKKCCWFFVMVVVRCYTGSTDYFQKYT